jgi:hypothetical protein
MEGCVVADAWPTHGSNVVRLLVYCAYLRRSHLHRLAAAAVLSHPQQVVRTLR